MFSSLHASVKEGNNQIAAVSTQLATFETDTSNKFESLMSRVEGIESQLTTQSVLLSTTAPTILSQTTALIKGHDEVILGVSRVLEVQQKERTVCLQKLNEFRDRLNEVEDSGTYVEENVRKIMDKLDGDARQNQNQSITRDAEEQELASERDIELNLDPGLSDSTSDVNDIAGGEEGTGSLFGLEQQSDPLQTPRASRKSVFPH